MLLLRVNSNNDFYVHVECFICLIRHRTTSSLVGSGSVGLIKSATTELRDRNAYVALFRTNSVSSLLTAKASSHLISNCSVITHCLV